MNIFFLNNPKIFTKKKGVRTEKYFSVAESTLAHTDLPRALKTIENKGGKRH